MSKDSVRRDPENCRKKERIRKKTAEEMKRGS